MRLGLSITSGVSFIFFGLACFFSDVFMNEFDRYGLSKFLNIVGFFQLLGGMGCIIGIFYRKLLIISSLGLSVMMLLGVGVRLKINDTLIQTLPALIYLIINATIFIDLMIKRKN